MCLYQQRSSKPPFNYASSSSSSHPAYSLVMSQNRVLTACELLFRHTGNNLPRPLTWLHFLSAAWCFSAVAFGLISLIWRLNFWYSCVTHVRDYFRLTYFYSKTTTFMEFNENTSLYINVFVRLLQLHIVGESVRPVRIFRGHNWQTSQPHQNIDIKRKRATFLHMRPFENTRKQSGISFYHVLHFVILYSVTNVFSSLRLSLHRESTALRAIPKPITSEWKWVIKTSHWDSLHWWWLIDILQHCVAFDMEDASCKWMS